MEERSNTVKEMGKRIFGSIAVTTMLLSLCTGAFAQDDIFSEGSEELLFDEIPVVISAARMAQLITEAPSTISVVTAEDIKMSGATNIPDALRMVPGVDVIQISQGHYEVTARGFNQLYSNKMLVMIDGRSVYQDYFGAVEWDNLPLTMQDIKRIEVVRGPGSAMYGANAFNGVINIITYLPDDIEGTRASVTAGERDTFLGSIIHSGGVSEFSYNMTLGWKEIDQWENRPEKGTELGVLKGAVQYNIDPVSSLSFEGGVDDGEMEQFRRDQGNSFIVDDVYHGYFQTKYNMKDFMLRLFWKHEGATDLHINTYDSEFQNSLATGENNKLLYGGSYRHLTAKSSLVGSKRKQDLIGLFVQDEYRPIDSLILVAGVRYDDHPITGGNMSPRGSIVYRPWEDHTFSAMAGKAYRNPTVVEIHQDYTWSSTYWSAWPWPGGWVTTTGYVLGNDELEPEEITSYEVGYQGKLHERVKMQANLFYNDIEQIIDKVTKSPTLTVWENTYNARAAGYEIGVDLLIAEWLSLSANYSYQKVENRETNEKIDLSPENKFNARLDWRLDNGLSGQVSYHFVDNSRLTWVESGTTTIYEAEEYNLVNASAGYRFLDDAMEARLSVFNVFNDKHKEFPNFGDEIGSRVNATVSYKF
jgi:iron complex outermembrane receptor protein